MGPKKVSANLFDQENSKDWESKQK